MKLYADEDGSDAIRALGLVVVSMLARVEVPAAIWRKVRMGEVGAGDGAILTQAFEADWNASDAARRPFVVVALPVRLLDHAAVLAATQELRAYDAIQLASALAARDADPGCDSFACFDAGLRRAAAAEGFVLLP